MAGTLEATQDRTFRFARRIIRLVESLPRSVEEAWETPYRLRRIRDVRRVRPAPLSGLVCESEENRQDPDRECEEVETEYRLAPRGVCTCDF